MKTWQAVVVLVAVSFGFWLLTKNIPQKQNEEELASVITQSSETISCDQIKTDVKKVLSSELKPIYTKSLSISGKFLEKKALCTFETDIKASLNPTILIANYLLSNGWVTIIEEGAGGAASGRDGYSKENMVLIVVDSWANREELCGEWERNNPTEPITYCGHLDEIIQTVKIQLLR